MCDKEVEASLLGSYLHQPPLRCFSDRDWFPQRRQDSKRINPLSAKETSAEGNISATLVFSRGNFSV